MFAEHESEEGERRIHASECVVAPLFSRLAEALGVLAVSSQKLDRRRGSSAAPFLLPGSSSALTAERKPGEPVQPSSRAILIEFFMVRALRKPKRQIARSASRRMAPRAKPTELYYWPTPNGWKISIMLEECGLPYVMRPLDISKGQQFSARFPAISVTRRHRLFLRSPLFTDEVDRLNGVMNKRLADHECPAERYSIADMACVGWVRLAERQGQDLAHFPISNDGSRRSVRAKRSSAPLRSASWRHRRST